MLHTPHTSGQRNARPPLCLFSGATPPCCYAAPHLIATAAVVANRHGRGWQVEKTHDLMAQTERMASALVARAEAQTTEAKGVAQASERQAEALREANEMLPSVEAAVQQALGAVRYVAV